MYAKLAWRNIRRSLQDYAIYFMTLVFAVAIFYVFSSLEDQPGFLALRENPRRLAEGALEALKWLSFIMTGLIALLILYANRVIIKKRSRELGTYLLLGMEQGRLSVLLMAEIVVIGTAAMLIGLISGIFLSQFFALVVNRVFAAELTSHPFVFSTAAAGRTLLAYGITFVLVGLWQAASVYRQKLIDLINGVRRNEEIPLRSRTLSVAAGVLSALALGVAYWLSYQVSQDPFIRPADTRIWLGVVLGIAGTFLLFAALAGLLTGAKQRSGGWLSRGLNIFLYRQVTSKIRTHSSLLATIALMLTLTICAMSTGLAIGNGVGERADRQAPFDYLLYSSSPTEDFAWVLPLFAEHGVTKLEAVTFVTADSGLQNRNLMLPEDAAWFHGSGTVEFVGDVQAQAISFSAYQQLRSMKGYPRVDMPDNSYLIHTTQARTIPEERARESFQRFLSSKADITLGEWSLQPALTNVLTEPLGDHLTGASALLVVPDPVAASLPAFLSFFVAEIPGQGSAALDQAVQLRTVEIVSQPHYRDYIIPITRSDEIGHWFVIEGMMVFLAFYVGVMFILISATLLALQQVTDAVEHRQRFQVLRKLGTDDSTIDGVIARQVGLYFLTPVTVALLHSLVAMTALSRLLRLSMGFTTVWPAALVTLGIFSLIYGTYYLLSLQSCRSLFRAPRPQ